MKFGEKLRKYRTEKGMTQSGLAKEAGLGINTISITKVERPIHRTEKYILLLQTFLM